jgi:hypothetical protein
VVVDSLRAYPIAESPLGSAHSHHHLAGSSRIKAKMVEAGSAILSLSLHYTHKQQNYYDLIALARTRAKAAYL